MKDFIKRSWLSQMAEDLLIRFEKARGRVAELERRIADLSRERG